MGFVGVHLDTATNQPEPVAFYRALEYREVGREPTGMVLDPRLLHQGLLNTDPGVFALQIAETRAQNVFMTRTSGVACSTGRAFFPRRAHPSLANKSGPLRSQPHRRASARWRHPRPGPSGDEETAHAVRAMSWPSSLRHGAGLGVEGLCQPFSR